MDNKEQKYKELKGLCNTCLYGCQRLEDKDFNGVYRCEYYIKENKKWMKLVYMK